MNLVDSDIISFYDEYLEGKSDGQRKAAPYDKLKDKIMPAFRFKFQVPSYLLNTGAVC